MFTRREGLDAILHRSEPSAWSRFLSQPVLFLARTISLWHTKQAWGILARKKEQKLDNPSPRVPVTVVCISDTHNCQPDLPDGDILVHAGDLTQSGSLKEVQETIDWLNRQPHLHKIIVGGNHDLILDDNYHYHRSAHAGVDREKANIRWGNVIYLQNTSVTISCAHDRELKVYGSPFSVRHGNWAFQYPRATNIWDNSAIPADTDILITHGPPQGHLDLDRFGCKFLLEALWKLEKKPRLHVFGHVHGGYGTEESRFDAVQRAYDDVIVSNGGFGRLLFLLYAFLSSIVRVEQRSSTLFVNAAMVGGLRDEKRRAPIIINM